jgi:hypothetical protein
MLVTVPVPLVRPTDLWMKGAIDVLCAPTGSPPYKN